MSVTDYITPDAAPAPDRAQAAFRAVLRAARYAEAVVQGAGADAVENDELPAVLGLIRVLALLGHDALAGEGDLLIETVERLSAQSDARELAHLYREQSAPFTLRVAAELERIAAERAAHVGPGRRRGAADPEAIRQAVNYYERNKAHVTLEAAAARHFLSARTLKRHRKRVRSLDAGF